MPVKFSFVIPAYNEENYIGDCLDAIIRDAHGRSDIEIIVVDNNSNDGTAAAANARPGVTVLREMRRGANRTRQTGFEAAKGEIVGFIDADTRMPEGWIARVEREFAKDRNLVCISGPFIYYDLPMRIRFLVRTFYVITYILYQLGRLFFNRSMVIQGGNYAVRRDAFAKIGGQDVNIMFYGDDTDNAIRLSRVGFVKFTFMLPMPTSGRRLAKEGAFTMGLRYMINNFWMILFRRPFTMSSKEVRFDKTGTVYKPENRFRERLIASCLAIVILAVLGGVVFVAYYAGVHAGAWLVR